MKELSIEQKAQRYDEVIEKAKIWQNHLYEIGDKDYADELNYIFPELAESEDERIRKAIISIVAFSPEAIFNRVSVSREETLAWLEKQGEHANFLDKIQISDKVTRNEDGVLVNLSQLDRVANKEEKQSCFVRWEKNTADNKPALNHSVLMKNIHGIAEGEWKGKEWIQYRWSCKVKDSDVLYWMDLHELEKQCEQKPAPVWMLKFLDELRAKKNYFDWDEHKDIEGGILAIINWMNPNYFNEKDDEYNPVDKVEPKFHEGEWIIFNEHHNSVYQVERIDNYRYYLRHYLGGTLSVHFDNELIRPWTIQDAKDGDVLYTSSTASHETFIFKGIDEKGNAKCYFAYDSEDGFREGTYHFIGGATNCKPATKEQRDLLLKKMKEAGWEFDFEKKELKNTIVPIFNIGDTIIKKHNSDINNFGSFTITDITSDKYWYNDRIICNITEQDDWELYNPAWSEEDEEVINLACSILYSNFNENENFDKNQMCIGEIIDKLKSFKDRVQPVQKWSKYDESKKKFIEDELSGLIADERDIESPLSSRCKDLYSALYWLKSLRPQNGWKPNDMQINALSITVKHGQTDDLDALKELLEQLKKLKER